MSKTAETTAGTMSAQEAAKLLMLESTRRIQQLAQDGYIQKAGYDRYFTVSVVQGYIRFLKEDKQAKSTSTAQAKLYDQKTRDYAIRNAKNDHTLVELSETEAVIDEIASALKLGMEGVPARVTRDLPMRKKIEAAIDDVFSGVAARISETLAALRSSGEALDADATDDA